MEHPNFEELFTNNWDFANHHFLKGREMFLANIKFWSNVFGNLNKQKKQLIARINGIQRALANRHSHFLFNLEKELLFELNSILKKGKTGLGTKSMLKLEKVWGL